MAFDNSDYFADGTPPLRLDPRKSGYPQRVERHNAKSSKVKLDFSSFCGIMYSASFFGFVIQNKYTKKEAFFALSSSQDR